MCILSEWYLCCMYCDLLPHTYCNELVHKYVVIVPSVTFCPKRYRNDYYAFYMLLSALFHMKTGWFDYQHTCFMYCDLLPHTYYKILVHGYVAIVPSVTFSPKCTRNDYYVFHMHLACLVLCFILKQVDMIVNIHFKDFEPKELWNV